MWFRLGLPRFIAKKVVSNDGCDIFVSDFIRIWHKSLSDNELLQISKALNPLFEATLQKFKELTLGLFNEDEKIQKEIKENNNEISLKLESNRMGVKFQFQVVLELGNSDLLYQEFTFPLLLMTVRMHNKEKKLIKVIKDKDAELNEYKQEHEIVKIGGGAATSSFSEGDFSDCDISNPLMSDIISDPSIFLDFIDRKLLEKQTVIKVENSASQSEKQNINESICDKSKLVLKNKSINLSKDSKPCVKFGNEVIKRRKKHNLASKISI